MSDVRQRQRASMGAGGAGRGGAAGVINNHKQADARTSRGAMPRGNEESLIIFYWTPLLKQY